MPHDPRDRGDASEPERDAALLTAYVDGVTELSASERHRVEDRLARDPEARAEQAAVRGLLDRLRELDAPGTEPDWAAMERSIRHAVGSEVPRPWWRRWRWIVPASTLVTAATVLLALWSRPAPFARSSVPGEPVRARPVAEHDAAAPGPRPADDVVALWLDGAEVDVDLASPASGAALGDALGEPAGAGDASDDPPGVELAADAADAELGLLPTTDLAWVDGLDDAALERAERWLAGTKAGRKG